MHPFKSGYATIHELNNNKKYSNNIIIKYMLKYLEQLWKKKKEFLNKKS